ncbi:MULTISPECIES: hypothetical protein [Streptomyces]|uniref:hypothetical protein n=1 Tax=Streptomyces TaxID=1883 RepID=UPI000B2C1093|nr:MULTISPECIES: hypothetical protein [Streptomyces]
MAHGRRTTRTAQDTTDPSPAGTRHLRRSKRGLTRVLTSGLAAVGLLAAGVPAALN